MLSLFNKGINNNVSIKFYNFITDDKCNVIVRHSDDLIFKENTTYSLNGFLSKCVTPLDKLKCKLSELESKLYNERCRQSTIFNNRGWGYGMRHSKIGFSTRREDSIKERIKKVKQQIKDLEP